MYIYKFGNTLNDTFERRLTSLFLPYELDFQQAILLDRCWVTLKKCRVADAVKIMKTWSNGWATSLDITKDLYYLVYLAAIRALIVWSTTCTARTFSPYGGFLLAMSALTHLSVGD